MKQSIYCLLGGFVVVAFALAACGKKQAEQTAAQIPDTTVSTADTVRKPVYTALSSDSAVMAAVDTANPETKKMIGRFPAVNLVKHSFEYQSKGFLGAPGLDDVFTAQYRIGDVTIRLFVTDDRSGLKYVHLTEFATRQSQVQGANMAFDEGYSVVFHHTEHGWVLGGLKAGYLIGAVGYNDTCLDLISRWVKALK